MKDIQLRGSTAGLSDAFLVLAKRVKALETRLSRGALPKEVYAKLNAETGALEFFSTLDDSKLEVN